jgi:cobalt-zinc-cadmium efflux system protein
LRAFGKGRVLSVVAKRKTVAAGADAGKTDKGSRPLTHAHGPTEAASGTAAFRWAILLNTAFVAVEAVAGFLTGSLALLADAAHNLTDVAGLLIAWGAVALSRHAPSRRHTYGLGRSTILAALANAVLILIGVGAILWEAIRRIPEPSEVAAGVVLWVAAAGIVVNTATALLFLRDRHRDLNARGAFLHMTSDAAVSVGVVASALVILGTGWLVVDPLAAIAVSAIVGWTAFDLLRRAVHLSLDGVPEGVEVDAVERWLCSQPGVADVHDLHVWSLSTTRVALTAHLVMRDASPGAGFLAGLAAGLEQEFGIGHSTIQIECAGDTACRLAPSGVA